MAALNTSFEVEKAEITIFGKEKTKLEAAIPLIKKFAARFGINPLVKITEYVVPEMPKKVEKELPAPLPIAPKNIEKEDKAIKQLMEFANHNLVNFKYTFWSVIAVVFVFLFTIIIVINKATGKLAKSLELSLQGLGLSMESNSEKDENNNLRNNTEQTTNQKNIAENSRAISFSDLTDHSDETYLACLSDCYWGEFDSYASFLWKRIPVTKRSSILKKAPETAAFLSEYVTTITGLPEQDLSALDDPSYLNPLDIYHINNIELTNLVRKTNALAFSLSQLRLKKLELTLIERINLRDIQPQKLESFNISFKMIPASSLRKMKRHMAIELGTMADEAELMSLGVVTNDLVEEIPSLVWALKITDDELSEILKNFSAKDLSYAWIAPEEVLVHISKLIPVKKLELLQSFQKKIIPTRDSASFKSLHTAIAMAFSNSSVNLPENQNETQNQNGAEINEAA